MKSTRKNTLFGLTNRSYGRIGKVLLKNVLKIVKGNYLFSNHFMALVKELK